MNEHVILPVPDVLPLPAPAILLQLLLQLTWLLHVLAMNAMLGGILLTVWHRLRATGTDDPRSALADTLARTTPSLVATTVTLGVAPLLFLQVLMGQYFFTSSVLMGWSWFSIIIVLIAAYYGTYLQSFKGPRLGSARLPLLVLTALGFLWIGFMFSNNTNLMLQVRQWSTLYFADARGLHLSVGHAMLAPRYVHMVLGAVAIAGLMLAWWGRIRLVRRDPSGGLMQTSGLSAFTWFTLANSLVGLWYFMAVDRPVRRLFMGGDAMATGLLMIGLVLAVVMIVLAWRMKRATTPARLMPLTAFTLVQMLTMISLRDIVRRGSLIEWYRPEAFEVQTQVLNLALFVVLLVVGIGTLVWMLRRLYLAWND